MNNAHPILIGIIRGLNLFGVILLSALVWGYRIVLKPLFPATCRYEPSCSAYALEALRRRGPVVGAWLAAWRVLRCNPWGGSGYDPVPDREPCRHTHPITRERS